MSPERDWSCLHGLDRRREGCLLCQDLIEEAQRKAAAEGLAEAWARYANSPAGRLVVLPPRDDELLSALAEWLDEEDPRADVPLTPAEDRLASAAMRALGRTRQNRPRP